MNKEHKIKLMAHLLNETCDIAEELQEENEDLKNALDMTAAHVHGLNKELEVLQRYLKDTMTYNEYTSLWTEARVAFREGKDKWRPDES